mmetsp:Transcript_13688/g.18975  ORF Transcript_13688/g.18975 Transcript_13688/m.18975 type:complete len:160 (-) Transcript_13688:367-846(-)
MSTCTICDAVDIASLGFGYGQRGLILQMAPDMAQIHARQKAKQAKCKAPNFKKRLLEMMERDLPSIFMLFDELKKACPSRISVGQFVYAVFPRNQRFYPAKVLSIDLHRNLVALRYEDGDSSNIPLKPKMMMVFYNNSWRDAITDEVHTHKKNDLSNNI